MSPAEQLLALDWLRGVGRGELDRAYEALLDQALATLVRRVHATDRRVSRAGGGARQRPGSEPPPWARLWRRFVPGRPRSSRPPLMPLLQQQIGLDRVSRPVLADLARPWRAVELQEGQEVFLEGQPGDAAYLVGEGRVEVVRNVEGDKASLLAELGPGDLFGANALIDRCARTASCIAARPGWVYRIAARDFEALRGEARLAWRESLLAGFASQIRAANLALTRAVRAPGAGRGDSPEAFASRVRAHGMLEALPLSEHSVDLGL